jgi:hypothetical protein
MMGLLATILVVTTLAGLVMFTAGRETALSGTRYMGTRTLYVAEGGAVAGRVALMAFTNSYPGGTATVDPRQQHAEWVVRGRAGEPAEPVRGPGLLRRRRAEIHPRRHLVHHSANALGELGVEHRALEVSGERDAGEQPGERHVHLVGLAAAESDDR